MPAEEVFVGMPVTLDALLLPRFETSESEPNEEKSPVVGVAGRTGPSLEPPPSKSGTLRDFRFADGETMMPAVVLLLSRGSPEASSSVMASAIMASKSVAPKFIDRRFTILGGFSSSISRASKGDVGTAEEDASSV